MQSKKINKFIYLVLFTMKALVTGGTGFLGSHIVDELINHEYDVTILVRNKISGLNFLNMKVKTALGDITNSKTLFDAFKEDYDVIFNNAAIMEDWGSWSKFATVNVEGTRNILDLARKKDVKKIVHTSSTAVYGFPNKKDSISEDFPKNPFGNYQKSKTVAEEVINEYINDYDMHIVSIRPPMILGSRDRYTTPLIVETIRKGKMVILGDGKQMQSIVHARDAAQCIRLASEKSNIKGEAFNVKSFDIKIEELYCKFAELLGEKTNFRHIPYHMVYTISLITELIGNLRGNKVSPFITPFRVKLLGTHYLIDSSKAKNKLGFHPLFDANETVQDSVNWYLAQEKKRI